MSENETGSRTVVTNIVEKYINVPTGEKHKYITQILRANKDWKSVARLVNMYGVKGASQDSIIRRILENKKKNTSNGQTEDDKTVEEYNLELASKSKVKHYDFSVLAPESTPLTIPYLEIYRTDQLNFKDYVSPFLSSAGTSDTSGESGTTDSEESGEYNRSALYTAIADIVNKHVKVTKGKENGFINRLVDAKVDWTAIARIINGHPITNKGSQDTVIRAILNAKKKNHPKSGKTSGKGSPSGKVSAKHSGKSKNSKLQQELLEIVKEYFKSNTNYTTLVNRYMSAKTNKSSIGAYTKRSSVHLHPNVSPSTVNDAIYEAKKKYS